MSLIAFGILPIILLIGLALLAGLIILLVKGGAVVRWIVGIFLLLALVAFLGLFTYFARPVALMPSEGSIVQIKAQPEYISSIPMTQNAVVDTTKETVLWQEGLEEELTPDVYSTPQLAAYGLGVQLQETFNGLPAKPKQIQIFETKDSVDIVWLEQLRRGLKFFLSDIDIAITAETTSGKPVAETVWISLKHEKLPTHRLTIPKLQNGDTISVAQMINAGNERGTLQAAVQTPDNKYAHQVEYDYRPWLHNGEYFRTLVHLRQWAVITSAETAVTAEQARSQMMESARQKLIGKIGLQSVQQSDLQDYGFIVDEYTQRLQGSAGPIWRSAVLLEMSPERLQMLGRDRTIVVRQTRRNWAYYVVSLIGMIVLISIVGAFINALTKGYYSVLITVAVIGIVLIFGFFLIHLLV